MSDDEPKKEPEETEPAEETKPLGSSSATLDSNAKSDVEAKPEEKLDIAEKKEPAPESKSPEKIAESRDSEKAKDSEGPSFEGLMSLVDFESKPTSRVGWLLRAAVTLVGIILLWKNVGHLTGPMLSAKAPTPIPTEELAGDKFRLSEAERKEIFREFATAELAERQRAITQNTWQGHAWSREDDRGYIERTTARTAAARHHCSLSQVYLVLDEGIREHWLGPDGKPLPATTPPFNPRTTW